VLASRATPLQADQARHTLRPLRRSYYRLFAVTALVQPCEAPVRPRRERPGAGRLNERIRPDHPARDRWAGTLQRGPLACHARFRPLVGATGEQSGRSTSPGCCPSMTGGTQQVRSIWHADGTAGENDVPGTWRWWLLHLLPGESGLPHDHLPCWQAPRRTPSRTPALPVGRCAWSRLHTTRPRVRAPGPRGAALLSACPQQAVIPHPRPRPQSLAGPVHRSCPGLGAGKRRAGQVRRSTHRRDSSCAHNRSVTPPGRNDVPGEAGRGALRWQASAAWSRLGRRFGVDPKICAMARVTYRSKDNAGHKFWTARYGRYAIRIDATRRGVYRGSSARRAARSARGSLLTVTRPPR
jgi:hypothetical protein